jgi:hypothetical protein
LVAGGAFRFVDVEAVAEDRHFQEDVLVVQRVEVMLRVQILVVAV